MPNIKSAKKKMKQDLSRTARNEGYRSSVAKVLRVAQKGTEKKNEKFIPNAYASIDKAAKKGVIHKNKAARLKKRVTRLSAQAA